MRALVYPYMPYDFLFSLRESLDNSLGLFSSVVMSDRFVFAAHATLVVLSYGIGHFSVR